jgi:hypothetical protein
MAGAVLGWNGALKLDVIYAQKINRKLKKEEARNRCFCRCCFAFLIASKTVSLRTLVEHAFLPGKSLKNKV